MIKVKISGCYYGLLAIYVSVYVYMYIYVYKYICVLGCRVQGMYVHCYIDPKAPHDPL